VLFLAFGISPVPSPSPNPPSTDEGVLSLARAVSRKSRFNLTSKEDAMISACKKNYQTR
jgi:hypothetical protein